MDDIEYTDDLLENEYLNDGFDDVDCDVDDLMKTKGRISTGSRAKTVEEEEMAAMVKKKKKEEAEKEQEQKKEDEPLLDYSDFFADDNATTDGGAAVMQLKSVPVMKQSSSQEDPDSLIFPLPYSERRAVVSPQVDEMKRESRSSQDLQRAAAVSPIINTEMSKALSKKIAAKAAAKHHDDMSEPYLPSIKSAHHKKPPKKVRLRAPNSLGEKSVASEKEAAREDRLPPINKHRGEKKVVPLKSKRNKAEIAQAKVCTSVQYTTIRL